MSQKIFVERENFGFPEGTLVHAKDSLKPIEEIQVGDWVLSHPQDEEPPTRFRLSEEYVYKRVVRTFFQEDEEICEVILMDFGKNSEESVKTSLGHPFYVGDVGWVSAEELNFRCKLYSTNNANLAVGGKARCNGERAKVFNLEVEDFHTYYVGELGVWVHG